MTEENSPERKRNTSKGPTSSYNFLLGTVFIVVAIVFLAIYVVGQVNTDQIDYSDLIRLVNNSRHVDVGGGLAEGYSGSLKVSRRDGTVLYSELRALEVGPHAITGKVGRQTLDSEGQPVGSAKEVTFRTDKDNSEDAAERIREALDDSNITFKYAAAPSIWRSHGLVLLMIALFVLLFIIMLRRLGGAGSPMAFGRSRGRV